MELETSSNNSDDKSTMDGNEICRLCFCNNDLIVNLQSKNITQYDLVELLIQYLEIKINEDDQFSKIICKSCMLKLIEFHKYAIFVKENQKVLTEKLQIQTLKKVLTEKLQIHTSEEELIDTNDEIKIEPESITSLNNYDEMAIKSETTEDNKEIARLELLPRKNNELENSEIKEIARLQLDSMFPTRNNSKLKKSDVQRPSDKEILKYYKFECDLCKNHGEIDSFAELNKHYRVKHGIRKAYIKCCGKKLVGSCVVIKHIEEHLLPDCLICSKCGKSLKTKMTLLLHMDTHVPVQERPFKCKYCEMRFCRKRVLVQHARVHLTQDQLKYRCDECSKKFPTKCRLKIHLQVAHTDDKPFFCEFCAKSFKSKVQLVHHRYTHENQEKMFKQCEHCGIWLKSPRTYRSHMRDRHDENAPKTFACKNCSHVSPTRAALSAHFRNIHGIKKKKCNICNEMFTTGNLLTSHMIKHTGPGEPLQCPFCPKTFSYRSGLYSHKKKHHPNGNDNDDNNKC